MEREIGPLYPRRSLIEDFVRLPLRISKAFLKMLIYVPAAIGFSILDDLRDRRAGKDVV